MNTVPYFLLGEPIEFKEICTIYPLTIGKRVKLGEQYFNSTFLPYSISEDIAKEHGFADVFSLIISDRNLLLAFCESLEILCNVKEVKFTDDETGVFLGENQVPMDSTSFREFSKIVRDWNCIPIYKPEVEPFFATEEGREKWLKLKALRAKNAKSETDLISTMMSVVQFGGNSFIPESVISNWTYWKLVNSYHAIINSREYEHSFSAYLQSGKKELVKDHWTDRVKPKQELV